MTRSITAVAYLRVARSHPAGNSEALGAQRKAVARRAEQLGAHIIEEVHTPSHVTPGRDGLQALLTYVTKHHVDYCIVPSLDKLARGISDYNHADTVLRSHGVTLVTADGDNDTASDCFSSRIRAAMAEWAAHGQRTETTAR